MQPDKRFPFHVTLAPLSGRGQFLLFTRRKMEITALPGTQCLVEQGLEEEFGAFVDQSEGKALARAWGVSGSTLHRIREALGLAGEYDGSSKVTAWRRRRENPDNSNEAEDDFRDSEAAKD